MRCVVSCSSSAARVHDSQAYRKMDVTRDHISRILEIREILLSFQTGFNLVHAAVICAMLESTSGLEPSSVEIEPRYLKLVTVSGRLLSIYFNLCVDAIGVVCHQLSFLSTDLHAIVSYRQSQEQAQNRVPHLTLRLFMFFLQLHLKMQA